MSLIFVGARPYIAPLYAMHLISYARARAADVDNRRRAAGEALQPAASFFNRFCGCRRLFAVKALTPFIHMHALD